MRIPPPETVPYQRPDHRLWPSTRPVVVTVRPEQGGKRLDQKTPDGPIDCPAGSWSCWDAIAQRRAAFFQKWAETTDSWSNVARYRGSWWVLVATAGFCSAVKGSHHSVKTKSIFYFNEKWLWSFLPNYICVLYLVRDNESGFIKVLTWWYNQSGTNSSLYWTLNWLKDKVSFDAAQCNQIQ